MGPPWSTLLCLGTRKDFADIGVDTFLLAPMLGISHRDLLKTNAISPIGRSHVEVTRHHGPRSKSGMPILGEACSTPWAESGNTKETNQIIAQGVVVDEDDTLLFRNFFPDVVHSG